MASNPRSRIVQQDGRPAILGQNRVKVALGKCKTRLAITYRVDPNHWRWALDGGVC